MIARAKNSAFPQLRSSPAPSRRLPPLKALQAFEAASRRGSFARGADELHVTPSAVSHQIKLLEDFVGVELFKRHAGRAVLTKAGAVYAREIAEVFGRISDATDLVSARLRGGHLVIAASPSFASKWLQPRLPGFLYANPKVKVRLTTLSESEDLGKAVFDVAIVFGQNPHFGFEQTPLLNEQLRPMCSPAVASALRLEKPADLVRATLIHSKNAVSWADYFKRAGCGGLSGSNELWLDRSAMAIEAAVAGIGVIFESELLVEREMRDGQLVALFEDSTCEAPGASYFLMKSDKKARGVACAVFERWLRDALTAANVAQPAVSKS